MIMVTVVMVDDSEYWQYDGQNGIGGRKERRQAGRKYQ